MSNEGGAPGGAPGGAAFSQPSAEAGGDAGSQEDADVGFQPPAEGLSEQAAISGVPDVLQGMPSQLVEAKSQVEHAIRQQGRPSGVQSIESFGDTGNIQGVGIGLSEPGGPGEPGQPVLSVFVAEPVSTDQVRSVVVDALGVQAAGDVPLQVVTSGLIEAQTFAFRIRPAPGGVSVGHFRVTAGTIGCLATGRSAPRNQRLLVLSNNHVLANSNNAAYWDCISQPGRYDGGRCPADQIAVLERFVPIVFGGGANYVDCATGWCWPDRVRRELIYYYNGYRFFRIGAVPRYPYLGQNVGKTGRTTQLRSGRVVALGWSGWIYYGAPGYAWFTSQFVVQGYGGNFSAGGDSGSSIWSWDSSRAPVGLLFAGGGGYTIANYMPYVVAALDINLYT